MSNTYWPDTKRAKVRWPDYAAKCWPDLMPLLSVGEAIAAVGFTEDGDSTFCCGELVEVSSFIGPYAAKCKKCGRAIYRLTGPIFSPQGNTASLIDYDAVDLKEGDREWVVLPREVTQ